MSATPLALEQSKVLPNVGNPYEIIEQPRQLFRSISRIQYHEIKQLLTEDELVLLAKEHTSVLCIVNTRKEAQRVFQTMNRNNSWDRIYHFSTTMCSAHRLRVIKEIKEIQNDPTNKETIAVISTQALEAGIDISFPAVFRMYAPFDSIIQSAGRCNRENVLERGNVYLFDLINRQKTDPYYEKATILTKSFIARYGIASLNNPDACITYFRELYSLMEDNGLDRYNINKDKLFQFKEVAEDFKMIENQHQVSVLCLNYPGFPHDIYEEQTFSREWIRMLQPFMIPLSIKSQDIQCINEIYVWEGTYDPDIGYQL